MKRSIFAVAAFSFLAFAAHAQQSSGNLMGNAKPGDTVEVTGVGTGFHREVQVEADTGKWTIRRVPIGSYEIVVKHADGSADPAKGATVNAGVTARIK